MTLERASQDVPRAVLTATAGIISWQAAVTTLVALLLPGMMRLLLEKPRRRTFAMLVAGAPEGTVVVQEEGPGARSMKVTVGRGARRPSAAA